MKKSCIYLSTFVSTFVPILVILLCGSGRVASMPSEGVQELRELIINENYTVHWQTNFGEKTIEFNVTARTSGYVGFGLSVTGGMSGADIIMGGVYANGTSYFGDYYGAGPSGPGLDLEQNWELLDSWEMDGVTFLRVKRVLDTCDANDIAITDGTIKIIWALGRNDLISYHGSGIDSRGPRAVNLLDAPRPPVDFDKFQKFEVRRNMSTPTGYDTRYWCTINKRTASQKSHIVAFKPILETPEALAHTHHYQLTICKPPPGGPSAEEIYEPWVSFEGEECYQNEPQIPRQYCTSNMYAWTNGGEMLVFPENIGVPWGEDENEYFLFNVHINNPDLLDVQFETGVTIYYTEDLREIEAGLFEVYHNTHPSLVTPPDTPDWTLVGHCSSRCTAAGIDDEDEGINILTANLHAHISSTSIKVRHFRDGEELPWVIKDDHYDFNYQEYRTLPSPVKILPGDALSIECVYDSTWKSPPSAVIGGFQTSDEMCIMFSYYYPKKPEFRYCGGMFPLEPILERYGATNYTLDFPTYDPVITEPPELANVTFSELMTSYVNWTSEEKADFQEFIRFGPHYEQCSVRMRTDTDMESQLRLPPSPSTWNSDKQQPTVGYPPFDEEYTEPSICP